jgi:predicted O-linked N-acetylglucosamine transferase (SPINDLY family)
LAEAEACYRQVLAAQPDHADALHLLGIIAYQTGRHDLSVELIRQAIQRNGRNPAYFYNLGNALKDQGNLDEAIAAFRRAIAIKPDWADAHLALGNSLNGQGKLDEAIAAYGKAIAVKPDHAMAHSNLGVTLREQGKLDEAISAYQRAIAIEPDYAEAHSNLGSALRAQGKLDEAIVVFRRALAIRPDLAGVHSNLGNALRDQRRLDEAIASYRRAIVIKPDYAEAHSNLGNALKDQGKLDEAISAYRKAIAIKPDYAGAHSNLGVALLHLKQPEEALASFGRALAVNPDQVYAFSGAVDCVMRLCDWGRRTQFAADVKARVSSKKSFISPFVLLGCSGDPALQLQCAKNHIENEIPLSPRPFWTGQTWRHDKLRVAYLSADFRNHPMAYLTAELYELHDRSRFEIFGVSFGVDDHSEMRRRLARAFDAFHDVRRASDQEVARLLYDLKVDIAVDLTGYTEESRSGIFAYRPAPIQVNYLGYPGTMGTPFIDYIIADETVAPFEQQQFYAEKIAHLPDCFQVNDSKRKIAEGAPTRREMGLPEHAFVFCCFNNNWKITPDIFEVWMRLLHQVEGSVLWLFRDNEGAERNLREEARRRGVDPSRLVFARRLPLDAHLARHRLADLFLDTLPYNAHTTASDALWAGLPVLTCKGEAFAGRVAGSLLRAVGIPELFTPNLEDYQALALQLAREPALLARIKAKLAAHRDTYPLFDSIRFTRHIEAAYATMWETWQRGEAPKSFSVEPIETGGPVGAG